MNKVIATDRETYTVSEFRIFEYQGIVYAYVNKTDKGLVIEMKRGVYDESVLTALVEFIRKLKENNLVTP